MRIDKQIIKTVNVWSVVAALQCRCDNISDGELMALKLVARELMSYEDKQFNKAMRAGELKEVTNDE